MNFKLHFLGTIILRDATYASELPNTQNEMTITENAVLDIEINNGFSALSSDLLRELERLKKYND